MFVSKSKYITIVYYIIIILYEKKHLYNTIIIRYYTFFLFNYKSTKNSISVRKIDFYILLNNNITIILHERIYQK